MKRFLHGAWVYGLTLALLMALVGPTTRASAAECDFVLGFKAIHDAMPDIVGDCLVNEHFNVDNGDSLQETTGTRTDGSYGGLLVWRKADNWTAYSDGYRTWVNGPYGLQQRLNTERFAWENDGSAPVSPQPATPLGLDRSHPAPVGTEVQCVYKDLNNERVATINVKETIRGGEAWNRIQGANKFNSPPPSGHEYLLARIWFRYDTGPADVVQDLNAVIFKAISSGGKEYGYAFGVEPTPQFITKLYPGAAHEGWTFFPVAPDDAAPVIAFGRKYDGTGGCWFKLQ